MHGIGYEQAAFEAKILDQRLRRRNLVAFVVSGKIAEAHRLILSKDTQHMGGLQIVSVEQPCDSTEDRLQVFAPTFSTQYPTNLS